MPRLLAKFVPGAGIVTSLYQGFMFLLNNQQQLADFFQGFLNSMDTLLASLTNPSEMEAFTNSLVNMIENRALPVLLNFGMSQLGLGNLRQDVQKAIQFIPNQVDLALRAAVSAIASRIVGAVGGNTSAGSLGRNQLVAPVSFTYKSQNYKLYVVKNSQGVKVLVGTGTGTPKQLTADKFDTGIRPDSRTHFTALVNAGTAMATATSPTGMANGQAGVTAAENVVKTDILAGACTAFPTAINIALGTRAGLATFAADHDAKYWLQWTREDFGVLDSTRWNPNDTNGGIRSLFADAVRTAIPGSNLIYFKLTGFDLDDWFGRYTLAGDTFPPGSTTAWEAYQLVFCRFLCQPSFRRKVCYQHRHHDIR